jgi:phosphonate transport system substrate-binding protein
LSSSAWEQLLATGQVDPEHVRVIATTAPYFDYSWSVRGKLEPALREQIRQAFLQLNPDNAQHQAILELQGASRFIETRPENYAELEQAAHAAGLLR